MPNSSNTMSEHIDYSAASFLVVRLIKDNTKHHTDRDYPQPMKQKAKHTPIECPALWVVPPHKARRLPSRFLDDPKVSPVTNQ